MLKHLPPIGKTTLTALFNKIWKTGEIPRSFKVGIITGIPKADKDPKSAASYRPISLTSHIGKLLETIINRRLVCHLEHAGILNPSQTGFRTKRQALEQVALLETQVRAAQADPRKRKAVVGIFLDLEKAFDVMDRGGVLEILRKYGIGGNMYNYIQNFFTDRQFKVRVGNALSEIKNQENGTPQGAVLSPTLFCLAINGVPDTITNAATRVAQYADDTAIWRTVDTHKSQNQGKRLDSDQMASIGREVTNLVKYLKGRGFKVNAAKTQVIIFNTTSEHYLNIDGVRVNSIPEAKYLGITLDQFLTYKTHMKNMLRKGSKALPMLWLSTRRKWGASKLVGRVIYKNIVEARVTYGQELYHHGNRQLINQINRIHYRAQKLIAGAVRGTSARALEVVTGELPPELKREQAQVALWARVNAIDSNTLADTIQTPPKLTIRQKHDHLQTGLAQSVSNNLETLGLDQNMIAKHPKTQPHTWKPLKTDTDLKKSLIKRRLRHTHEGTHLRAHRWQL